jgi:hypothetical protein
MQTKPWYTSKTIWIGIVTLLASSIPLLVEFIKQTSPDASAVVTSVAGLILGVLQIVRRIYLDTDNPPATIGSPKSEGEQVG